MCARMCVCVCDVHIQRLSIGHYDYINLQLLNYFLYRVEESMKLFLHLTTTASSSRETLKTPPRQTHPDSQTV